MSVTLFTKHYYTYFHIHTTHVEQDIKYYLIRISHNNCFLGNSTFISIESFQKYFFVHINYKNLP